MSVCTLMLLFVFVCLFVCVLATALYDICVVLFVCLLIPSSLLVIGAVGLPAEIRLHAT